MMPGWCSQSFFASSSSNRSMRSSQAWTAMFCSRRERPAPGQERYLPLKIVTSDYFRTMEIPLIRGRVFTAADERMALPLIRYFEYGHLRTVALRETSRQFYDLAVSMDHLLPDGSEKSTALRKLLEAKDAAVRATLDIEGAQ